MGCSGARARRFHTKSVCLQNTMLGARSGCNRSEELGVDEQEVGCHGLQHAKAEGPFNCTNGLSTIVCHMASTCELGDHRALCVLDKSSARVKRSHNLVIIVDDLLDQAWLQVGDSVMGDARCARLPATRLLCPQSSCSHRQPHRWLL